MARFVGDFRSADREWAEALGLGDRLELIPYAPAPAALELQRDSEALLLLIPEAGGRGKGVLSGKVFEYLAAERPILAAVPPDGAAAELIRETGAGVVAPPDDVEALREALAELHARFANGGLAGRRAPAPRRATGSRAARGSRSSPSCCASLDEHGRHASPTSSSSRRSSRSRSRSSTGRSRGDARLSDVLTALFLVALRGRPARRPGDAGSHARRGDRRRVLPRLPRSSTCSASSTSRPSRRSRSGRRGWSSSCSTSSSSSPASRYVARRSERFYWSTLAAFCAASPRTPPTASSSSRAAEVADVNLDQSLLAPLTGGASPINVYGAIEGASVYRPNALTGDPNHLGIELVVPLLVLTPIYLRLERGHRLRVPLALLLDVPAPRRARDALAQRPARARRRPARARGALPAQLRSRRAARAARPASRR